MDKAQGSNVVAALTRFLSHCQVQFCEIILNLDKRFRRCLLKIFVISSSGGPFVQWSRTICAILEEGIKRNNSVKLF